MAQKTDEVLWMSVLRPDLAFYAEVQSGRDFVSRKRQPNLGRCQRFMLAHITYALPTNLCKELTQDFSCHCYLVVVLSFSPAVYLHYHSLSLSSAFSSRPPSTGPN